MKTEIVCMISLDNLDKIILCTKNGSIVILNAIFISLNDDINYALFETNINSVSAAVAIQIRHEKKFVL